MKQAETKTYQSVDGVDLSPEDSGWIAAVDTDSFNYVPQEIKVKRLAKAKHLFWSRYDLALEECNNLNSL